LKHFSHFTLKPICLLLVLNIGNNEPCVLVLNVSLILCILLFSFYVSDTIV
jgi:hypothetical protein